MLTVLTDHANISLTVALQDSQRKKPVGYVIYYLASNLLSRYLAKFEI